MSSIVISTDEDQEISWDTYLDAYACASQTSHIVGMTETLPSKFRRHLIMRFPLTTLPVQGLVIDSVELQIDTIVASTLGDILEFPVIAYDGDGQANPSDDSCEVRYARTLRGSTPPYVAAVSITPSFSPARYIFRLGGAIVADLLAAKRAVDRFSLVMNTEVLPYTEDVHFIVVEGLAGANVEPKLFITYHQAHLPNPTGQLRSRGVVTDQQGAVKAHIA